MRKEILLFTIVFVLLSSSILPAFSQIGSRNILEEYCQANWKTDPTGCSEYIVNGNFQLPQHQDIIETTQPTPIPSQTKLNSSQIFDIIKFSDDSTSIIILVGLVVIIVIGIMIFITNKNMLKVKQVSKSNVDNKKTHQNENQRRYDEELRSSASDALHELGKQINNDNTHRLSEEKILEERRKRERRRIEQEEIRQREKHEQKKVDSKSEMFSHSKSGIPSIDQILHSNNPYDTFNISQAATCDEIKSKFKELSLEYNAAKNSVNRTTKEQELITKAQAKIINAYDFLKKQHCG